MWAHHSSQTDGTCALMNTVGAWGQDLMGQVTTTMTALCKKQHFREWTNKDDRVESLFPLMQNSGTRRVKPSGTIRLAVLRALWTHGPGLASQLSAFFICLTCSIQLHMCTQMKTGLSVPQQARSISGCATKTAASISSSGSSLVRLWLTQNDDKTRPCG